MFEVTVEQKFAAGHSLRNYKGRCEKIHGHNWKVEVTITGEQLNSGGMLIDFLDLKAVMNGVIDRIDHEFLNEVPPFDTVNPSAENIAWFLHQEIAKGLGGANDRGSVRVSQVKVWETDDASALYRP